MKLHEPSRILNETRIGFFGLTIHDFMALVGLYGFVQVVLSVFFKLNTIVAIIILFILAISMIFIRQKFRRHIVRDFVSFKFNRIVRFGVWYDKNH